MTNTTKKGDDFRDLVATVLRAAGFRAETEAKIGYKNVDVSAVWSRDKFGEPERYGIEAKDYSGPLPLSQCTQFAADYGPLVQNDDLDYAWLISRGDFTPAGREAASKGRRLQAFTFSELQRRLLQIDRYLHDLKASYDNSGLSKYYIPPQTTQNQDLEALIEKWLDEPHAPPLFILAAYGKGKSTFAKHIAAIMAQKALDDPLKRVPLLFPLGEIVNEQSLDGLFGKVLASQHRVENYHYETVRELNRLGRFLVIFDGFDEMKHGMTIEKFQNVMIELMKIDEGNARVLVLGRDTAFHDDYEFRLIVGGKQRTSAGIEIAMPNRRPYSHLELRGFTIDESRRYVRAYFPILVAKERPEIYRTNEWVEGRISELLSSRFDELLERPVHAEMLCQVALQPDALKPNMTVTELYDQFVHYLLQREISKPGRDPVFQIDLRRNFNASIAWWLWERGGASTTTLNDIPQSICQAAASSTPHSLTSDELRRELIQGCLIEKGLNTIYFGHRSLQEFLVAEHLINTDLLQSLNEKPNWLNRLAKVMTKELEEFVVGGLSISLQRAARAKHWFSALSVARIEDIPTPTLEFLIAIWLRFRPEDSSAVSAPWSIWLNYCLMAERRDFSYRSPATIRPLVKAFGSIVDEARDAPAAMQIAARNMMTSSDDVTRIAVPIAAALPIEHLVEAIEKAKNQKSWKHLVRKDENYRLWSLLRSWKVIQKSGLDTIITIDPIRMLNDAEGSLPYSFSRESLEFQGSILEITPQQLYQAYSLIYPNFDNKRLDGIRPYFNSAQIRSKIAPIEVEIRNPKIA